MYMNVRFGTRATLVAAIGCCVSFAAYSQVRPPSPPGVPGPGPLRPQSPLTEEQREQLREAMQQNRPKLQELEQNLREARRELNEAIFAEKYDEATTRQKAMAVAQLETERVLLRARALDKIRPTLTPVQLERLKQMPLEFAVGPPGPPEKAGPPGSFEPSGRADRPLPVRVPAAPGESRDRLPAK